MEPPQILMKENKNNNIKDMHHNHRHTDIIEDTNHLTNISNPLIGGTNLLQPPKLVTSYDMETDVVSPSMLTPSDMEIFNPIQKSIEDIKMGKTLKNLSLSSYLDAENISIPLFYELITQEFDFNGPTSDSLYATESFDGSTSNNS